MLRLATAAVCVVLGAVVYLAAVHVHGVAVADLQTLRGFEGLPGKQFSADLTKNFNPGPFVVIALALVAIAFVAGRRRAAVAAFITIAGASVSTQILKPLLSTPRDFPELHYEPAIAFPSGHTTAVMSLSLALIMIAPARWRPLATAVGGLLTVATVFSILSLSSHYPSDIVGGLLMASAWACVASAAVRLELKPSFGGPALAAIVLGAAAFGAVLTRPAEALAYAQANTTFVFGALAIAAGALVLSGSVPAPKAARMRPRSPHARG
jgi:membrane-associated phospholipid phosphatase